MSQAPEIDPARLFIELVVDCEEHDQRALLATAKEYLISKLKHIKRKKKSRTKSHEQDN